MKMGWSQFITFVTATEAIVAPDKTDPKAEVLRRYATVRARSRRPSWKRNQDRTARLVDLSSGTGLMAATSPWPSRLSIDGTSSFIPTGIAARSFGASEVVDEPAAMENTATRRRSCSRATTAPAA
jgi:hypothetical protein